MMFILFVVISAVSIFYDLQYKLLAVQLKSRLSNFKKDMANTTDCDISAIKKSPQIIEYCLHYQ